MKSLCPGFSLFFNADLTVLRWRYFSSGKETVESDDDLGLSDLLQQSVCEACFRRLITSASRGSLWAPDRLCWLLKAARTRESQCVADMEVVDTFASDTELASDPGPKVDTPEFSRSDPGSSPIVDTPEFSTTPSREIDGTMEQQIAELCSWSTVTSSCEWRSPSLAETITNVDDFLPVIVTWKDLLNFITHSDFSIRSQANMEDEEIGRLALSCCLAFDWFFRDVTVVHEEEEPDLLLWEDEIGNVDGDSVEESDFSEYCPASSLHGVAGMVAEWLTVGERCGFQLVSRTEKSRSRKSLISCSGKTKLATWT